MTRPLHIRQPKLAHVAMAAGVSIGTASDALNGKGRMSDEVRQRVMDTAEALGYRPNANARILALGRSEIVALVTHGPAGSGAPRVYWPQLQAAFTERLLDHGMVAATMTLDDLTKLDGLPFDLIVYAGLDSAVALPEQIRSGYRVLDIDMTGTSGSGRRLRGQFDGVVTAVLDVLVQRGSRRPGLVITGDSGREAREVYQSWCHDRGIDATVVDAGLPDRDTRLGRALQQGLDAVFSFLVDGAWLLPALADERTRPLNVVSLGPVPAGEPPGVVVSVVRPDGQDLGSQIADSAFALLRGDRPRPLDVRFLLDEDQFPVDPVQRPGAG